MEKHLERALIETYYALAEFDALTGSQEWRISAAETQDLARVLFRARGALEAALDSVRARRSDWPVAAASQA
jgi:hypothetical protein